MATAPKDTKIALIEDDIAIVQMYRTKFENEGYHVEVAGDGKTGLALIKQFHPDVVLLDIMMPEMNGLDMLAHLRANPETANMRVVILTNMGDSATASKVLAMKATDYLVKAEMTPKEVLDRIQKLLTAPSA